MTRGVVRWYPMLMFQSFPFWRFALVAVATMPLYAMPLRAATPPDPSSPTPPPPRTGRFLLTGTYGAFMNGRFAAHQGDQDIAAESLLRALTADPRNEELIQPAFVASLMAGRVEAVRLARLLPDVQAAQLLLVNQDIKAGGWDAAESRIRALPRQGLTQILQPMLLAWAHQGAGRTDAALTTLRPLVEGQRMRGIYALHSALINDLAGRTQEAARLYRVAQSDGGAGSLRMAQIVARYLAFDLGVCRRRQSPRRQRALDSIHPRPFDDRHAAPHSRLSVHSFHLFALCASAQLTAFSAAAGNSALSSASFIVSASPGSRIWNIVAAAP